MDVVDDMLSICTVHAIEYMEFFVHKLWRHLLIISVF